MVLVLGLLAACLGLVSSALWWSIGWARHATDDLGKRQLQAQQLQHALEERNAAIDILAQQLEGESAARYRAEEAARQALHRLAREGDPAAVADALRDELQALADMSTPATRARDYGARSVHGEIRVGDGDSDDTDPGA